MTANPLFTASSNSQTCRMPHNVIIKASESFNSINTSYFDKSYVRAQNSIPLTRGKDLNQWLSCINLCVVRLVQHNNKYWYWIFQYGSLCFCLTTSRYDFIRYILLIPTKYYIVSKLNRNIVVISVNTIQNRLNFDKTISSFVPYTWYLFSSGCIDGDGLMIMIL